MTPIKLNKNMYFFFNYKGLMELLLLLILLVF